MDKMITDILPEKKERQKKGNELEADEVTNSRVDALESKFDMLMALVKNSVIGNQRQRVEGQSPLAKEVECGDVDMPKAKKRARSNTIGITICDYSMGHTVMAAMKYFCSMFFLKLQQQQLLFVMEKYYATYLHGETNKPLDPTGTTFHISTKTLKDNSL
uniref:Uncharacterized protein n=1 Tax=Romanomermis culicivorax TaxID=13658 RepID=A0A915KNW4_ROMCU